MKIYNYFSSDTASEELCANLKEFLERFPQVELIPKDCSPQTQGMPIEVTEEMMERRISILPTLIFVKNDREIGRLQGNPPRDILLSKIESLVTLVD